MSEIELEGGGIKKVILTEGTGDAFPSPGSSVDVHYVGTLMDGTKFDSSRDRSDTFKFTIGKGQVIKGWDIGVATMKKGEKAMLTCKPEYAYGEGGSPPTIPPNATLQFEVELFGWTEPGRDNVTDDGGVQKLTLVDAPSYSYDKPEIGAVCKVNITGEVEKADGKNRQFFNQADYSIDLADTSLVWGLEEALLSMVKGQKCRVFVEPKYGYGNKGHKKLKVAPDSKLIYEIELVDFTNPPSSWDLKTAQKIEEGQNRKLQGNTFFKAQNWARAAKRYSSALELVEYEKDLEAEQQTQLEALKVSCLGNLAQCKLKEHEFQEVIDKTTDALKIDPDNAKNLFRRAKAFANVARNQEAVADLKKALLTDEKNTEMQAYLAAVQKRIHKEKQKERNLFKGMFNKVSLVSKKEMEEAAKPAAPEGMGEDFSDSDAEDEKMVQDEVASAEPPGDLGMDGDSKMKDVGTDGDSKMDTADDTTEAKAETEAGDQPQTLEEETQKAEKAGEEDTSEEAPKKKKKAGSKKGKGSQKGSKKGKKKA
eukprot:gb/GEZN01005384.1/.p1 GENE.gb/GEZN01005384.1/~~gb/GEZN01005384.1/.p1  ORF type:complete len:537 (+),score=160.65 gb/GEZN01005384.1/:100-1710(+)